MAQIFEDVNDTNGIETVVKQGSGFLQHEETLPAKAAEHFRDLCQIIPNWSLYLELKQDLQKVVCGEGSTVGLPNDVELDIVEVDLEKNAQIHVGPLGYRFVEDQLKQVSFFFVCSFFSLHVAKFAMTTSILLTFFSSFPAVVCKCDLVMFLIVVSFRN